MHMTYLYAYLNNVVFTARSRMREEHGQTMAEYGVILAVITVAIIGVLIALSTGIQNKLQSVVDVLTPGGGEEGSA